MESNAALRAQFAPSGVLRAGINLGNPVIAQAGAVGNEPQGVKILLQVVQRQAGVIAAMPRHQQMGEHSVIDDGVVHNERT